MKILVDGEALAHPLEPECGLWSEILPSLIDALHPHGVYFLSRARASAKAFPGTHLLAAPQIDFRISLIEDRRLAALCAEVGIDVFLSTYYSSAGAKLRSTFVATDSTIDRLGEPDTRKSIRRAARLASTLLAVSQKSAEAVCRVCDIPEARVSIADATHPEAFVAAIVDSFVASPEPDTDEVRRAQEEITRLEARQLRAMQETSADKRWQEEMQKRKYPHWIPRIWKAVWNPRRYPQYLTRLERHLVRRSSGNS